jgi:eukaryotic-like serine/threonine-protein kinase
MPDLLRSNQSLYTQFSKLPCAVKSKLGEGGQGEVYQAELQGKNYALKWYKPEYLNLDQDLNKRLQALINKGSPSDQFLWPLALIISENKTEFGYIMPLRPNNIYKELAQLLYEDKLSMLSFKQLTTAGFQLADSFSKLHAKGMCYWDINFRNIFLNPDTGDILICDNDNATVPGEADPPPIYTPGFAAPEYLKGNSVNYETDIYSLSVLLFYLLHQHHPLEGRREYTINYADDNAHEHYKDLYDNPLFIFDPNDESNRPVPGGQDRPLEYWAMYPQFLRSLFIQAFTKGLKIPSQRVQESEWRRVFVQLQDAIYVCPHCGTENFFDDEIDPRKGHLCWNPQCQKLFDAQGRGPFRLRVTQKHVVMLNPDTKLFAHHIESGRGFDFSKPVAEVRFNPERQEFGLLNCTTYPWMGTNSKSSKSIEILPGESVQIKPETRIHFGRLEGEIII